MGATGAWGQPCWLQGPCEGARGSLGCGTGKFAEERAEESASRAAFAFPEGRSSRDCWSFVAAANTL